MDCCGQGHTLTPRQWMWSAAPASVGAMLAGDVGPRASTSAARTAETASDALEVLREFISVDVHSHGGKTGITSKAPPNDDLASAMRAGSIAVACLADVPDGHRGFGASRSAGHGEHVWRCPAFHGVITLWLPCTGAVRKRHDDRRDRVCMTRRWREMDSNF